jgi:hypothetical protein
MHLPFLRGTRCEFGPELGARARTRPTTTACRGTRGRTGVAILLGALCASSCASVKFTRDTETSGRFRSSGLSFTILAYDMPKRALDIARENASDSRQSNLRIEKQRVFPYLGPFDWILDIISIRYARIDGRWGFEPTEFDLPLEPLEPLETEPENPTGWREPTTFSDNG